MVNLYSRLYLYLYYIFVVSILTISTSHALEPLEIQYGGFAETMYCSHPSDLSFCTPTTQPKLNACQKWLSYLQATPNPTRQFNSVTLSGNSCIAQYTNKSDQTAGTDSTGIITRAGKCPAKGASATPPISFSRQGRWFAQEVTGTKCWKGCDFGEVSFTAKHLVYTNGIITQFTQTNAKSLAQFCIIEPEPVRNSNDEITYESNCDDAVFKQICDFINWFRTDAEMPVAPPVESTSLDIDQYLKTDRVLVDAAGTIDMQCFAPQEFNLYLPWASIEVKQTVSFMPICDGLNTFGNFLRALYLLHAALIIFRR